MPEDLHQECHGLPRGSDIWDKYPIGFLFQEKHPPTLLFGLHLIELVTLGLLTIHCIAHCHTFGTYLKSSYLKMRQRATEKQARKEAEENEKIELQVQKRMKEKREAAKLNPSIELENMG